jgi:hypothetical protein
VSGSVASSACAAGGASYGGAQFCRAVTPSASGLSGPGLKISPGQTYGFGPVALGQTATEMFTLSNLPNLPSLGAGIDQLTLLSYAVGGPFSASGISFGTVVDAGDSVELTVKFTPNAPGPFNEDLRITTDQNANFGDSGEVFDIDLTGTGGVPEPATWSLAIAGISLLGLALRRSRRKPSPETAQA